MSECLPTVQDVNLSMLEDCSAQLDVHKPSAGQNYFAATGDADGVEDRNGRKAFKCWEGTPELHLAAQLGHSMVTLGGHLKTLTMQPCRLKKSGSSNIISIFRQFSCKVAFLHRLPRPSG